MMKQQKQLLILTIVLTSLVVIFFSVKQYNKSRSDKEEATGITLVDVSSGDIIRFSYEYEGGTYTYEKEENTWYYSLNHSLELTQYMLTNMISNIAPLIVQDEIAQVTDLTQYGLDEPSNTITFETADTGFIFYVGDYNTISGVYYIIKPSDTTVYTVTSSVITEFEYGLFDLVAESEEEITTETTVEETIEATAETTVEETTEATAETAESIEEGTK